MILLRQPSGEIEIQPIDEPDMEVSYEIVEMEMEMPVVEIEMPEMEVEMPEIEVASVAEIEMERIRNRNGDGEMTER